MRNQRIGEISAFNPLTKDEEKIFVKALEHHLDANLHQNHSQNKSSMIQTIALSKKESQQLILHENFMLGLKFCRY